MGTYPFVNFKMAPVSNIDSTPTLIFGNDQYTCLVDSLLVSNLTDNAIMINFYIAREIVTGTETNFTLVNNLSINSKERIDILKDSTINLQPGDLLYGFSDFSGNIFNAFISYRELTELTAPPTT